MMSEDIHKWTDGRYTLMFDEHTFFVWDNEKEERMIALEVTKKLNEQQATIEEQNKEIEESSAFIIEQRKENKTLKEENEQLRQQVQNAKELAVENDVKYQICCKEKEDFQNMCEQLRQQLQEYKENWDDMVELATKTSLRNVELDEQIGQLRKELKKIGETE